MMAAKPRLLALLLLALAPLLATAQSEVHPADARAMREVIEAQIEAFRRDDAEGAFALATPGIRATFGSAENFLAMVRNTYAVVYRPASVAFDAPKTLEGEFRVACSAPDDVSPCAVFASVRAHRQHAAGNGFLDPSGAGLCA